MANNVLDIATLYKQTVEAERKKMERRNKPKQERKRYEPMMDVYTDFKIFAREHPEAFFQHRTIKDKTTGQTKVVPVLDKYGNKKATASPTQSLWKMVGVGDSSMIIPRKLYDDLTTLVGKTNAYNINMYNKALSDFNRLPENQKNKQTLSDYLISNLGLENVEEHEKYENGKIKTYYRPKTYHTQYFLSQAYKRDKQRYQLSTQIQKTKDYLEKHSTGEYKKRRDETFRDNFINYLETLGVDAISDKIISIPSDKFRQWFDTVVVPSFQNNGLLSEHGQFFTPYQSDQPLTDKQYNTLLNIVNSWSFNI